ncbi:branched-chain amino acid ABC transporter permease [Natronomonas sp. EA1]|uniref:branched-chain amino acid ABC transporter permease n=1 Tax=Natronomonas sp. EA1 TaxID=3421655 RepID=UPI003EB8CA8E
MTDGGLAQRTLDVGASHAWKLIGLFALVLAVLPFAGLPSGYWTTIATELFLFAVLALSWDLIGGQTGYPSFGQMAFFGVGAYTTAVLVKKSAWAFPPAFLLAGVLAVIAAAIIGVVVLRLRGGYFAIATLGVLLVAQQVTNNLEVTNGPDGIILFNPPDILPAVPLSTELEFYYLYLLLLVVEIALVYYLMDTRFGHVLNTIRDDEVKATAMGFNTTYYKTAAWVIAGLFTGLAGAGYPIFNTFVDPLTAYNGAWNVELIAMALLGGAGTVAGPVLGAFGLRLSIRLIEGVDVFAGWQLVIIGLVVIGTVIAFPKGIVGTLQERASSMEYYKHGGQAASETGGDAE